MKYKICIVQTGDHELQMKSREPVRGRLDREELQLVGLLHKISSIFGGWVHFSSSSRIWTCRSRRVRKLPNKW